MGCDDHYLSSLLSPFHTVMMSLASLTTRQFMLGMAVGLSVAFVLASFHSLRRLPVTSLPPQQERDFHKELNDMLANLSQSRLQLESDTHMHHGLSICLSVYLLIAYFYFLYILVIIMLSGSYIVQANRAKFNQYRVNPNFSLGEQKRISLTFC